MRLGKLPYGDSYGRSYQCVFGGLNENLAAQDGEIQAMENMSSDQYPLLAPRGKRYETMTLAQPHGLSAQDKLCWVDGEDFYYDGAVKGQVEATDKQLYYLNSYVVIWPDKKFYNTATDEFGSLEESVTVGDDGVRRAVFCSSEAPNGISSEANCLIFDGVTLQGHFRAGDGVTISGCTRHPENNLTLVVRQVVGTALYFYDNSFTLDADLAYEAGAAGLKAGSYNFAYQGMSYNFTLSQAMSQGDTLHYDGDLGLTATIGGQEVTLEVDYGAFGDGWITFTQTDVNYTEPGAVTVSRTVPDMTYLCQCDNRLWGVAGSSVYCSYLGDPRIWNNYEGTATGCWSVEVGSGGAFTGAYAYGGYPLLFKENHIYRVYGTRPANFQLMDTETLGCEAGSEKSFAVVGQTLYYKSRVGFVAYAGGVPSLIDSPLGLTRRQNAVAGTDGRKYYVSVEGADGKELYVYDTSLGLWHREDRADVMDFAWCAGELYMLLRDGAVYMTGRVRTPQGTAEQTVVSAAELGDFYSGTMEKKTISRLYFRVQVEGRLRLLVSYDGGPWEQAGQLGKSAKGLQTLQLIPRRCDSLRVRLEGQGDWRLWALSREYFVGSTR
jgi:hypothetical protein